MFLGIVFTVCGSVVSTDDTALWLAHLRSFPEDPYAEVPASTFRYRRSGGFETVLDAVSIDDLPDRPGALDPYLQSDVQVDYDDTARGTYDSGSERIGSRMSVGVDLRKRFYGRTGKTGELMLQAYLVQADDLMDPLLLFHEVEDWEVQWNDTNYNHAALPDDLMNIRVGHFDLPFGLEPTIDEQGSLRQFLHESNFGFREDWGITVNGGDGELSYEAGWTRGTGNDFRTTGDPGLVSGRVGAKPARNVQAGVSFLEGRTMNYVGPDRTTEIVDRQRVGVDFQIHHRGFALLTEASMGSDENENVHHRLVELNWSPAYDETLTWLQFRNQARQTTGWDDFLAASLGIETPIPGGWLFSAEWTQELDAFETESRIGYLSMQLRMLF